MAPTPDVVVPGGHGDTSSQSVLGKATYVPCGVKMHPSPSKQAPTVHCAAAGPANPIRQSRNTAMATGRADECVRTMCDLRIIVFGTPPRRPPTDELVVLLGGRAQVNSS